jgi:hypothetical protein
MSRLCTVCSHARRTDIESDLIGGALSFRDIARQYRVSKDAVARHRADHLPGSLTKAHEIRQIARADALIDEVRSGGDRADRLYNHAETILERALASKDLKTALNAIGAGVNVLREARSYLELRGEITGELNKSAGASPTLGIDKVEKMLVIRMPKTPRAEAEERRILAEMGDKFSFTPPHHPQIASPAPETDNDDDQEGH